MSWLSNDLSNPGFVRCETITFVSSIFQAASKTIFQVLFLTRNPLYCFFNKIRHRLCLEFKLMSLALIFLCFSGTWKLFAWRRVSAASWTWVSAWKKWSLLKYRWTAKILLLATTNCKINKYLPTGLKRTQGILSNYIYQLLLFSSPFIHTLYVKFEDMF